MNGESVPHPLPMIQLFDWWCAGSWNAWFLCSIVFAFFTQPAGILHGAASTACPLQVVDQDSLQVVCPVFLFFHVVIMGNLAKQSYVRWVNAKNRLLGHDGGRSNPFVPHGNVSNPPSSVLTSTQRGLADSPRRRGMILNTDVQSIHNIFAAGVPESEWSPGQSPTRHRDCQTSIPPNVALLCESFRLTPFITSLNIR